MIFRPQGADDGELPGLISARSANGKRPRNRPRMRHKPFVDYDNFTKLNPF
jgi:hypothetical protein